MPGPNPACAATGQRDLFPDEPWQQGSAAKAKGVSTTTHAPAPSVKGKLPDTRRLLRHSSQGPPTNHVAWVPLPATREQGMGCGHRMAQIAARSPLKIPTLLLAHVWRQDRNAFGGVIRRIEKRRSSPLRWCFRFLLAILQIANRRFFLIS